MRPSASLFPHAATIALAFASALAIFLAPAISRADEPAQSSAKSACPDADNRPLPSLEPAGYGFRLDQSDEIAALESVQLALSEVADGSTYIWHRYHGRLSGVVRPTSSFRDPVGRVCRHVLVSLTSGDNSKSAEGVACRLPDGLWQLEG